MIRAQCKKCEWFQNRQGTGTMGDCYRHPVSIEKAGSCKSCGEFEVNRDKYHLDGRKIYTRVDTKNFKAKHDTFADSIEFSMNDTGSGLGR